MTLSRRATLLVLSSVLFAGCGGGGGGSEEPADVSNVFVHTAGPGNIDGGSTRLSHPVLDDNPSAIFAVTHVLNPGGALGSVNPHPFAVRYIGFRGEWEIFNVDGGLMEAGASFNVTIDDAGVLGFVHMAIPENTSGHVTELSHFALDGDPSAKMIVTQYAGAPDTPDYFVNPANVGVFYSTGTFGTEHWRIFNQGLEPMTLGAKFFVILEPRGRQVYAHDVTAESIEGPSAQRTTLNHPSIDGNPFASLQVTAHWKGVYDDHPIGVFYDSAIARWSVVNVDDAEMPVGAAFNVWFP